MLYEKYQNEQKELETKIRQLHEMMEAAVQTAADAEKWIALMKQYVNPVDEALEMTKTLDPVLIDVCNTISIWYL